MINIVASAIKLTPSRPLCTSPPLAYAITSRDGTFSKRFPKGNSAGILTKGKSYC